MERYRVLIKNKKHSLVPTLRVGTHPGRSASLSGFTMLEILVVLVIIGMISVLVGPRLVGTMEGMNIETAARKTAAALRYARSQAASEKKLYSGVFDLEKNTLTIRTDLAESIDSEQDASGNPNPPKVYELPYGLKFEKALDRQGESHSDRFEIVFYPRGNSTGGQVVIANEEENRFTVSVDFITGTVQLSE